MTKNQHSQSNLSIQSPHFLLLGTGGTIAGLGGTDYIAAQLPVEALLPESNLRIVTEQIAQIDSKDMNFDVWDRLHQRLVTAMNEDRTSAVVITHGTDTLEETAYFLHRTLHCTKPVILTGAMRASDSPDADGPANLRDAFAFAQTLANGVWVVFAGQAMPALGIQKIHPTRLDAFQVRELGSPPSAPIPPLPLSPGTKAWPRVEIAMSYAGASGALVEALIEQKVAGIVVASTGNCTLSMSLEAALHKAVEAGIAVRLTTRCLQGNVIRNSHHAFGVLPLSPVQARIELMLVLMQTDVR